MLRPLVSVLLLILLATRELDGQYVSPNGCEPIDVEAFDPTAVLGELPACVFGCVATSGIVIADLITSGELPPCEQVVTLIECAGTLPPTGCNELDWNGMICLAENLQVQACNGTVPVPTVLYVLEDEEEEEEVEEEVEEEEEEEETPILNGGGSNRGLELGAALGLFVGVMGLA
ncbi:hypothetical protein TrST_g4451 [Triparma strigata]|uniref:Uncharacterized protein n=1 Tax=Triparma strigata TaxID=1606541 RepID=A0A9W7EJA5_9STRA|nr:hypothetical protein TrST_g4451 [Triparma strigata]